MGIDSIKINFPLNIRHWIRHPASIPTCANNKNSYLTDVPASNMLTHQSPKPLNVHCQSQKCVQRRGIGKIWVVKAKIIGDELLMICNSVSTNVQHMSSEKWPWWRELSDAKIHRWTLHTVHAACNCLALRLNMLNFLDILWKARLFYFCDFNIMHRCTKLAGIFPGL